MLTAIASLVARSADLKRELLEFSWQPRLDRDRNEVLRDRFPTGIVCDEPEVIAALDYFLLQHELRNGQTVVERFVANRADLPEHERELLLGWRDVVEGTRSVAAPARSRCGTRSGRSATRTSSLAHNRCRRPSTTDSSNSSAATSSCFRERSSPHECIAATRQPQSWPRLVSRRRTRRSTVLIYPADLVASDAVAITHDETDGIGFYGEFRLVEEAFADLGLFRHPEYRRRVRDYLDDPTVSPLLFERMATRDLSAPTRCSVNCWGASTSIGNSTARS